MGMFELIPQGDGIETPVGKMKIPHGADASRDIVLHQMIDRGQGRSDAKALPALLAHAQQERPIAAADIKQRHAADITQQAVNKRFLEEYKWVVLVVIDLGPAIVSLLRRQDDAFDIAHVWSAGPRRST